jgi:hypothetical protein
MKYQLLAAMWLCLLLAGGPAATAQRIAGKILDAAAAGAPPVVLSATLGTTSNAGANLN